MQSAGQGNDLSWLQRYRWEANCNGTDGNPTFRRLANQSWLSKICNHFADIAAWSRKSLTSLTQKLTFSEKDPLRANFQKCLRKDSPPLRSTSCVQISWNLADRKLVKSCVIYLTKTISDCFPALASAQIAPKICQGQLQTIYTECPKFHPNPFTSSRVIAGHVNIVEMHHKVFPILREVIVSSPSNYELLENTPLSKMRSDKILIYLIKLML